MKLDRTEMDLLEISILQSIEMLEANPNRNCSNPDLSKTLIAPLRLGILLLIK